MIDETKMAAMISRGTRDIVDNSFRRETAARLLAGLLANESYTDPPATAAKYAVEFADAIIAELEKT